MGKKVVMPLANGFEEIEAVTIVDILRRAGVEVIIAGVEKRQLTGAHGIALKTDAVVADLKAADFDLIVLPGGHANAMTLAADNDVQALIKAMHAGKKPVAAICAAPVALQQAGVIEGDYTCFPGYEEGIGEGFKSQNVVESENIITSRGPGTAAAFAFALVARLTGVAKADALKKAMLF